MASRPEYRRAPWSGRPPSDRHDEAADDLSSVVRRRYVRVSASRARRFGIRPKFRARDAHAGPARRALAGTNVDQRLLNLRIRDGACSTPDVAGPAFKATIAAPARRMAARSAAIPARADWTDPAWRVEAFVDIVCLPSSMPADRPGNVRGANLHDPFPASTVGSMGRPIIGEVPHREDPSTNCGGAGRDPTSAASLGPVARAELGQNVRDVALDGLSGQEQLCRDLGVAAARHEKRGHLPLSIRQQCQRARLCACWPATPRPHPERPQFLLGDQSMRVGADRLCPRATSRKASAPRPRSIRDQCVGDVEASPESVDDGIAAFGELDERLKRLRTGGRSRCRPGNEGVNPAAIEGVVWVRVRSFNLPLSQRGQRLVQPVDPNESLCRHEFELKAAARAPRLLGECPPFGNLGNDFIAMQLLRRHGREAPPPPGGMTGEHVDRAPPPR